MVKSIHNSPLKCRFESESLVRLSLISFSIINFLKYNGVVVLERPCWVDSWEGWKLRHYCIYEGEYSTFGWKDSRAVWKMNIGESGVYSFENGEPVDLGLVTTWGTNQLAVKDKQSQTELVVMFFLLQHSQLAKILVSKFTLDLP